MEDTCFEKHGVPEWFPELKKKLCANERAANPSQTLLTMTNPSESSSNTGTVGRVLLASATEHPTCWIPNFGTTNHMTFDKNLFTCMTITHR